MAHQSRTCMILSAVNFVVVILQCFDTDGKHPHCKNHATATPKGSP